MVVDPQPGGDVQALADAVHDDAMARSPLEASLLGDHRFDAALPDLSPDGRDRARRSLAGLGQRLDRVDVASLPTSDRLTVEVASHVVGQARHELDDRYVWTAAGPMTSGAGIGSAATALLAALPKLVLREPAHADDYLRRCRRVPDLLAQAEAQLRAGVDHGCVPAARLVDATVSQLGRYLAGDVGADPLLLEPPAGWTGADRWRTALGGTIAVGVRPALARHARVLRDEIRPAARGDDAVGLCALPGGERLYREAVAVHTTTDDTAERLHDLGRDLLAALDDEYRTVGARALGVTDPAEVRARLRDDPGLRFESSAAIRAAAEGALRRAERALTEWFGDLTGIPCEVRPIPALEAPESTIAYYQPPALDGGRPGIYYVNTSQPHLRPRFEAEALAFHESVPGHHTQFATAMERDLPTLRRVVYLTAHAEGWGLYAERLADEMGLYSDEIARLGMLSFDAWRACRLVVDTGMHAFGWSRRRAIDFMLAHSPQSPRNIVTEVDRYIGWPGQALAYMAGRQTIVALRARAQATLDDRFDVAAFHRVLLEHGAVPLRSLERLVADWVAGAAQT